VPKPTYEFIESPNCNIRRKGAKISAVVIHYTESMSIDGTISWFKNPISKVSAHYIVGRDGRVVQMVPDEKKAWHAGVSAMHPDLPKTDPRYEPDVNQFSIGIELVGTADSGYTDRQLASLYTLIEVLISRYKIPPERVVGHSQIAPGRKLDPDGYDKQFNWAKLRQVSQVAFNATQTATVNTTPVSH
jgi:N-acetylmuramoyl-L-alanine amidase